MALCNQKGGVGKTTTSINLGAALAEYGRRVLAIDFDPQGALSAGLGVQNQDVSTIYELLLGTARDPRIAIQHTRSRASTSSPRTSTCRPRRCTSSTRSPASRPSPACSAGSSTDYDVILIDCQPSLGLLTVNALTAAHGVVIPLACEYFALRGVALLVETIDKVRDRLNPAIELDGIVATMYDPRTLHSREVLDRVVEAFDDDVLETVIGRTVEVPGRLRGPRADPAVRAGAPRRSGVPAAGPRTGRARCGRLTASDPTAPSMTADLAVAESADAGLPRPVGRLRRPVRPAARPDRASTSSTITEISLSVVTDEFLAYLAQLDDDATIGHSTRRAGSSSSRRRCSTSRSPACCRRASSSTRRPSRCSRRATCCSPASCSTARSRRRPAGSRSSLLRETSRHYRSVRLEERFRAPAPELVWTLASPSSPLSRPPR